MRAPPWSFLFRGPHAPAAGQPLAPNLGAWQVPTLFAACAQRARQLSIRLPARSTARRTCCLSHVVDQDVDLVVSGLAGKPCRAGKCLHPATRRTCNDRYKLAGGGHMPGHRAGSALMADAADVVRGIPGRPRRQRLRPVLLRTSFAYRRRTRRGARGRDGALQVWPAGQGRIEATQSGAPVAMTQSGDAVVPPGTCDFSLNLRPLMEALPCVATVTAGVPVRSWRSPRRA